MGSKRTLPSALALAGFLMLMSASAIAIEEPGDGITGVDWQLTSVLVEGEASAVPEGVSATLRLEDGLASGSTGCNAFQGGYTLDGDALTFQALTSTLRLCEDPLGAVEGPYLDALTVVEAWSFSEDGALSLVDREGQTVLEFAAGASLARGIESVTWILTQQAADSQLSDLPGDILVSMRLEGGAAGGAGGCNSWFADYVIDGDSLTFSEIGSTLMACDEPANTVERTFLGNLQAVASFTLTDAGLDLVDAEGSRILVFEAAELGTIEGSWVATGIDMDGGVVSSATTSQVTAEFGADGQLSGTDGCNRYDATYEVDGPRITVGPLASTKMACPDDELTVQANAYTEALARAATWSVEPDGTLQLRDPEGALLVSYEPAEG